MLRAMIALAALVACNDPADRTELLSASRLSLAERETARVHVAVAAVDDFAVVAPAGVSITAIADAFGPGFDLTPTCGAVPSANADLVIEVRELATGRAASLVVAVRDDGTDTCAADIAMWLEACATPACDQPCAAQPTSSTKLGLARAARARLCVAATALDTSRPLANELLAITPATSAFHVLDSRRAVIDGADWLVGPFRATFTATAGTLPVSRSLPLDIGAAGDVGIEVGGASAAAIGAAEFARANVSVVVHRFPLATDACELRSGAAIGDAPLGCGATNFRLYDADGNGVAPCSALPCGPSAHVPFTLSLVPEIDAAATVRVPLTAATTQTTAMTEAVVEPIASRAENLGSGACTGPATTLACADVDADGNLDVIVDSGVDTCIYSLPGFRDPVVTRLDASRPERMFALDDARVLGVVPAGIAGATLLRLDRSGLIWSWQPQWTSTSLYTNALPLRRVNASPPGYLVSMEANTIYFVTMAGQALGGVTPSDLPGGTYSLGIVDVGGDGEDLVVVGLDPADPFAERQKIWVYGLDWSLAGTVKPPALGTAYATATISGVPTTVRTIARRRAVAGNDELVIAFRSGAFASAVAEYSIAPGTLSLAAQFGAVRSVASAPDGSVLYGQESGARRSLATGTGTVRSAIDPIVELAPALVYGQTIAPCAGAGSFVVQTQDSGLRVAKIGIVPETP